MSRFSDLVLCIVAPPCLIIQNRCLFLVQVCLLLCYRFTTCIFCTLQIQKPVSFYSLDSTISLRYHLKSQKPIYVIANSFSELGDNRNEKTCVLYGEKDKLVSKDSIFTFLAHHNASLIIMKVVFIML